MLRLVASGEADVTKRLDAAVAAVEDLWRAKADEKTIEQLSTRIEQAYEQSHLLFTLARIPATATATALGEDRAIPVANGTFADTFTGYGVHLYRITY